MANTRGTRRQKRLATDLRRRRHPCCICRQPIDYTLEWPDPRSFSVEHVRSWHDYPALREDPTNLDAAHLSCNTSKGDGVRSNRLTGQIGNTSRQW
jgi:hypothetical protein